MEKIISLFKRDYEGNHLVYDEVVPGAEWVLAGEGVATRKVDGTCTMVRDGILYKRHEVKQGKTPPPGFEPASEVDPNTGKQQGWVRVGDGPEDRWHREAWDLWGPLGDGTYELLGPKVQGNPELLAKHDLHLHGSEVLPDAPRDFEGIREYLRPGHIEGIVWHHPDGRMVKIKAKDFGFKRSALNTDPTKAIKGGTE